MDREAPTLPTDAASNRAALGLWIALMVLLAARVALAFAPSMWTWGVNVQRFLPAWAAWPLTLVAALALVPPVARKLIPALDWTGDALARGGAAPRAAAVLAAALLVLGIPDRAWYVGDFLLRQGAVEEQIGAAQVFPQALPLDRLLHNAVPMWLWQQAGFDANTTGRWLGAIDAMVLMGAAIAFARALALRGAVAIAAIAVVFFGGYLQVFTGYSKAVVELCALTAAVGASGLAMVRGGRTALAFGVVLGLAFALHRSALGLLPAAVVAWGVWLRSPDARAGWRRPANLAGIALPVAVLAVTLPRAIATFRDVDLAVHLAPAGVKAEGGVLAAAFAGLRGVDIANLALMLTPLVLVAPVVLAARGRAPERLRELGFLAVLAVPMVGFVPFLHPVQGIFRDWDNFVASGAAVSLVVAWLVAEALRTAPGRRWVAAGVTACTTVFTVQWMLHHADVDRGMARMRAFLDGPPARTADERVVVLDYLGIRNLRLQRYAAAAEAFHAATDLVPNPRFMIEWGIAANEAQDFRSAREAYERQIARTPEDPLAWRGYTAACSKLGDLTAAKRGATELLKRQPGDPDALRLLAEIARRESEHPGSGTGRPRP